MFTAKIIASFRRNFLPDQHFKPLAAFWRSQKTQAAPLERYEAFDDTGISESEDVGVRPFEDIPGPKKSLRSMLECYRLSEGFFKPYKMHDKMFAKYGPIYKEEITLGRPTVHLMDPNDCEKVYRAEGKFPRRPINFDLWRDYRKRSNVSPGILLSDDEEWYRLRHSISPKIMRPKVVEENIDNFNAVTEDAMARLAKLKESCGADGHIPDLENELCKWSTESMGTFVFDARLGLYENPPNEQGMTFIQALHSYMEHSQKLVFNPISKISSQYFETPTLKTFLNSADILYGTGKELVNRRRAELEEMAEKGNDPTGGTQVVSLLTYLLTKKELTPGEVDGMLFDMISPALIQLSPVSGSLMRILDQDVVLSGYKIPAQTSIFIQDYCASRSEKYFKDALEFKPERWLRENKGEIHAFSSLAFGFGPRMCVGRRVSELEMYLFICKLLQRFRLEYDDELLEPLVKMFTGPDKPVKIKLVDRT